MNILSASQLKAADQNTIRVQNITSVDLMERASQRLFDRLYQDFDLAKNSFTIICGTGNNGGDGLALARMLVQSGCQVKIYLLKSENYSQDNTANQNRLEELRVPVFEFELTDRLALPENSIVIDALFGYGLSRPLDKTWENIISQINLSGNYIVAVDLPSGLLPDAFSDKHFPVIKADVTYTFQCPKTALLLPENAAYSPDFKVLDIDLDKKTLEETQTTQRYTTLESVKKYLIKNSRFAHKGTFGHSLIIGGSYGKIGAVVLSSKAALKTGCGLVTAYLPRCGYTVIQTAFAEAMTITDAHEEHITEFPAVASSFSAVGIGVGMGTVAQTQQAFSDFLKDFSGQIKAPHLVLDADALNILSQNREATALLPEKTILTPHPKELERLIGKWENDFDKLNKAKHFTQKYNLVVVIKGAHTVVVLPNGELHFNSTGNWGMATGGSGDVLTGVITSLLAQGYEPEKAAILGVFLHGLAADLQVRTIHRKSLTATDIIDGISGAWSVLSDQI